MAQPPEQLRALGIPEQALEPDMLQQLRSATNLDQFLSVLVRPEAEAVVQLISERDQDLARTQDEVRCSTLCTPFLLVQELRLPVCVSPSGILAPERGAAIRLAWFYDLVYAFNTASASVLPCTAMRPGEHQHLPGGPAHIRGCAVTRTVVAPQVRTLAQLLEMVDQERERFHGMKLDHVRATAKRNLRELWMGSTSSFHNIYMELLNDLSKQGLDPSVPQVQNVARALRHVRH